MRLQRRRGDTGRALEPRLPEKSFDGFGAGMRGGGTHAGKRQVREPVRERFDHATHLLLLVRAQLMQFLGEGSIRLGGSDALEGTAKLRELWADGA